MRRLMVVMVLVGAGVALACLWDSDTFAEEALTQKDVGEIVRGRLGKHSNYFYEEKVAYTKPLIDAGDAGVERYDDLAVAYEKLGQLDEAIGVMNAKEQRFPRQYTTLANLGTFYAHKGEFPRALELLREAIVMNPNAHFGREKYQVKAIEFMQALAADPKLAEHKDLLGVSLDDEETLMFGDLGKKKKGQPTGLDKAGISRDVFVALAGIIRYGSGEKSPHVWMSLGVASALEGDRHLAIRAFFRAKELGHPRGEALARCMARTLKDFSGDLDEKRLRAEFEKGQGEMKAAQEKEDALIRAGKRKQVFGY
jgi:tetratricopeptide (TPR) repeat protein